MKGRRRQYPYADTGHSAVDPLDDDLDLADTLEPDQLGTFNTRTATPNRLARHSAVPRSSTRYGSEALADAIVDAHVSTSDRLP